MFNLFSSETKAYKSLGGQEFKQEYSKSTQSVLIDVRTVGEFSSGSITGAKNIDMMSPDFKKNRSARLTKVKTTSCSAAVVIGVVRRAASWLSTDSRFTI